MNGLLLASGSDAGWRAGWPSLSGFRAARQRTRLTAGRRVAAARLLAAACLVALAAAGSGTVAYAADSLVGGDRPDIRMPRVSPSPPVQRPGAGSVSGAIGASSSCRSRCGSACQTMSCSGLTGAQCTSIRQQCRMNCSTGC